MLNLYIKSAICLVLAIFIMAIAGIGKAGQVPTTDRININVEAKTMRPLPDAVTKSAPAMEEQPPPLQFWSISPLTLIPKDENVVYVKQNGSLRGAGTFYAPVHLPQGATLVSLGAAMYDEDQSGATFIEIYMYRVPHTTAASEVINFINSLTVEESYGFEMITDTMFTSGSQVVDNSQYSYFVRATLDAVNPTNGMRLGPIVISYTE